MAYGMSMSQKQGFGKSPLPKKNKNAYRMKALESSMGINKPLKPIEPKKMGS
jgi:hypothetical protein